MNIDTAPKFFIYAVSRAIRHPRAPIIYGYCSACKRRIVPHAGTCPSCKRELAENPETRRTSPIPWWGSVFCIVIGIAAWICSACLTVPGLDEAARVLVYIPVGSLFGLSVNRGA